MGNYIAIKDNNSGAISFFEFFDKTGAMIDTQEGVMISRKLHHLKIGNLLQ